MNDASFTEGQNGRVHEYLRWSGLNKTPVVCKWEQECVESILRNLIS
jgi:hypothetical protein